MEAEEFLRRRLAKSRNARIERLIKQQKWLDAAPRAAEYQGYQVNGGRIIASEVGGGSKISQPVSNGLLLPNQSISLLLDKANFMPAMKLTLDEEVPIEEIIIMAEVLGNQPLPFEPDLPSYLDLDIKSLYLSKLQLAREQSSYRKKIKLSNNGEVFFFCEKLSDESPRNSEIEPNAIYETNHHVPCFVTTINGINKYETFPLFEVRNNRFIFKFDTKSKGNKTIPYISFCRPQLISERLDLPVFRYKNPDINQNSPILDSWTIDVTSFFKDTILPQFKRASCEEIFGGSYSYTGTFERCKNSVIWMIAKIAPTTSYERYSSFATICGIGRVGESGRLLIPKLKPFQAKGGLMITHNDFFITSIEAQTRAVACSYTKNKFLVHIRDQLDSGYSTLDLPFFVVACSHFHPNIQSNKTYSYAIPFLYENAPSSSFLLRNVSMQRIMYGLSNQEWVEIE